jgi:hypothetical protein
MVSDASRLPVAPHDDMGAVGQGLDRAGRARHTGKARGLPWASVRISEPSCHCTGEKAVGRVIRFSILISTSALATAAR